MARRCAPGNFLDEENTCRLFLPIASNLGYSLAVGIDVFINIANDTTILDVMESLLMALTDALIDCKDPCKSYVHSAHMVVMSTCDTMIWSDVMFQVSIKLRLSFLIDRLVARLKLEERLITVASNEQSNLSTKSDLLELNGSASADLESFFLPINSDRLYIENNCYLPYQKYKNNYREYRHSPVSKLLRCPQIVLSQDRYTFDELKQSVTLIPRGPLLKFGEFRVIYGDKIAVCADDFERIGDLIHKNTLETVLGIVTLTCVCWSMFCLFLAFMTYLLFPVLRTMPGNNNMCLIFALFLSQGFTQFGLGRTTLPLTCAIVGIFIHYFWLTTFFCMNVCSYHVFKVFVWSFHTALDTLDKRILLFSYISYSYGVPAVIIIVHITLSLPLSGSIGYGNHVRCFIDAPQAIVATFLAPIALLCLLNMIFFSISAYKIKTSPKVPSTNSIKIEFSTYLKLFLLTGFTWVAQIVESFLPLSAFSVVVAILNGSSGLFIFLSYTMNERVRAFYRERFSLSRTPSMY